MPRLVLLPIGLIAIPGTPYLIAIIRQIIKCNVPVSWADFRGFIFQYFSLVMPSLFQGLRGAGVFIL